MSKKKKKKNVSRGMSFSQLEQFGETVLIEQNMLKRRNICGNKIIVSLSIFRHNKYFEYCH